MKIFQKKQEIQVIEKFEYPIFMSLVTFRNFEEKKIIESSKYYQKL